MNRIALVTGASGFAGTHLSAWLRARGWLVREAINPGMLPTENAYPCDIADEDQVRRLISWAGRVTHVFHLAAVTFVPASSRNPARTMEINLNGTVLLGTAMVDLLPRARLIQIGSAAVYGIPETLPVVETHPFSPKEPYAISKAAADSYCEYLFQSAGLDVIRMRPFNHSGPGQPDSFVLSSFAHQIARIEAGLEPAVLRVGNLNASRDFLHVIDVVKAYEIAAVNGVAGEAYNVCSGAAYSVRGALDSMLSQAKAPINVEIEDARLRSIDIPEVYGSHEKLTVQTGWKPEIPFSQMLAELLDYWRRHP